ncbi:type II toxin-antitoxin system VapC family toxin [Devosia salina]|uniref:PIN domain-containing protein n=1 Tax=Devosia salina TaxID=2860336 RepID=A0ABX8WB76_9HYPH|nr:PIN domain-containing protein [Devosia salina]QYO75956.1 PIN domain-containing protein [Devosia salina]
MPFSRIYLDSNILIAALGGDTDPRIAMPLLEMIGLVGVETEPPFVTSELTLAESLVHPIRNGDVRQEQGYENALTTSGWLSVIPVSRGILWAAASLRATYTRLKLPDAIHVATALGADCPHLLTADAGLVDSYRAGAFREGVWQHGKTSTQIVRPDDATLKTIQHWLST